MAGSAISRGVATVSSRPLLAAAVVLPIAIFGTAAAFDYRLERTEIQDHIQATSTALAEHAQIVVETTDLVLARVLDRVEGMDWATIQSSADLHQFLLKLKEGLPQIESVFLVAPDGGNVATTRDFPLGAVLNVADREYFRDAKIGNPGTFISVPFEGRLTGGTAFTATRARLRNGVFDGLVGVTISPAYFRDFYAAAMDYPGESVATLVRDDGTVLFRFPTWPASLRRLPPESTFLRATSKDTLHGVFEGTSAVDGRSRMGAYRRLRNQPLFISYSVNSAAYLGAWRVNLVFIGGFATMLAAALLLTERVLLRREQADKKAAAALLQETERRQQAELALEQMQKMEALGRLTGGVAHDFNNLLTAILGPLELATRRTDDPKLLRLLAAATQAAQRGAKLTAQMLAVARKREAMAVLLDPNAVVRELGEMIESTIGPAIDLSYELDPLATPVLADSVQLEMTLVNLCVNARDAMPDGGRLLLRTAVRTLPDPPVDSPGLPAGDYVEISVTDTGDGMTEDVRARAVEPFFTTKAPGKGTGLGLSAAYGFARSAQGELAIASEPGRGTTVTLSLPRAPGTATAIVPAAMPSPGRRLSILLVDDDGDVRMATRELLDEAGHAVIEAVDGAAAMQQLRSRGPFDLLVTDFAMPGMSGAQLAEAARQVAPELPILFVTGYAEGEALTNWDDRRTRRVNKPFTGAEMMRAIQAIVAHKSERAA